MQETQATSFLLQGLLLCFGAAVPYLSFIPAPVPPLVPTSALTAARCPLPTDEIPQIPGPRWLVQVQVDQEVQHLPRAQGLSAQHPPAGRAPCALGDGRRSSTRCGNDLNFLEPEV